MKIKARNVYAFMFYGTFCYLIIMQLPVPPALNTIVSSLFGYYFGQRSVSYGGKK